MVTTVARTVEAFLLPFVADIRRRGGRVYVAGAEVGQSAAIRGAFDGWADLPWSRSPWRLDRIARACVRLSHLVREWRPDIVHVHTPVAAFFTRMALRRERRHLRFRVVYTAHGFHFYQSPTGVLVGRPYLWAEQIAGPWTDGLITINVEDYEAARRLGIARTGIVSLLPGVGIELDLHRPLGRSERGAVRQSIAPNAEHIVVIVAEAIPRKRVHDAVRVIARMRTPGVELVIVGSGPTLRRVISESHRLGIAGRVHALGFRRDVPRIMAAADLLVHTAEQEGLPRVVMEAMASGLPVVATDIRGCRDLLAGGAGMLCPVGDVEGMASAADRLLTDPEQRASVVRVAGHRIAGFDVQTVISQYWRFYQVVLGHGTSGATSPQVDEVRTESG